MQWLLDMLFGLNPGWAEGEELVTLEVTTTPVEDELEVAITNLSHGLAHKALYDVDILERH